MSSWNMNKDCCSWEGVTCDEMSGDVIELDLSCSQLVGEIDSNSMSFQLSLLQRLNLSMNDFYGSHISPQFGRFSSLTHLNLSNSNFSGQIPSEISRLSKLQFFLSDNSELGLEDYDFKMLIQNLTQLRDLHHSGVNISSTIPLNFSHLTTIGLRGTGLYRIIRESIFNLPNLETLDLSCNDQLNGYFPKTKWNSSISLKELDLVGVNFSANFLPESLGYLTSLQRLFTGGLQNLSTVKLSNNSLKGAILSWIFSLPSLSHLDLSNNHFSGQLKDFMYNSVLVIIDISENQLQGLLPKSIQNHESVIPINLALNQLQGPLPKSFRNIVNPTYLDLSYNSISLTNENKVKSTVPQSLEYLYLSVLNISRNHLEGCIPKRPQFATLGNNSYEGNDGLRGFPASGGCGSNLIPEKNNTTFVPDEEAYVMLSSQKPNRLSRIAEELEYRISMRNRKKQ
ncbi:hypothetical protein CQW23_09437 [Capsicum baccatum]|uniref:Leucine-rich repeat-containing N-terminal plant-type domain-containing protein n=1 Tax=Capsicum baccatum TaxID=33114 RepID=A0A2G2WWX7_CAPBA|nr:hypothetical protein CQW23_09437 [Capsicum baccatum]